MVCADYYGQRDILYDLANMGDLPLPEHDTKPSHKRSRDSEDPVITSPSSEGHTPTEGSRSIAGSKRVENYQHHASPSMMDHTTFSLPIHSDELGRLPLHPFFDPHSSTSAPMHPSDAWFTDSFGPLPAPEPSAVQPQPPAPLANEPMDPATFDAIFSMLPPASYQQATFPSMPPDMTATSGFPTTGLQPQSLSSVLSENIGNLMAHSSVPAGAIPTTSDPSSSQNTLDSDTLAMWSNVPSGFEYV